MAAESIFDEFNGIDFNNGCSDKQAPKKSLDNKKTLNESDPVFEHFKSNVIEITGRKPKKKTNLSLFLTKFF